MPRRKNAQIDLSKFTSKKISFEDIPEKTMRVTLHALRWVFLLVFLFITVGIFVLFITGGQEYVQIILGYSIAGFFTFFMGYFGWILAQSCIEMITGREAKEENNFSYYYSRVKRKKKYKF